MRFRFKRSLNLPVLGLVGHLHNKCAWGLSVGLCGAGFFLPLLNSCIKLTIFGHSCQVFF